jgi:glycosyltransferase involved in cell wall biosynthesis
MINQCLDSVLGSGASDVVVVSTTGDVVLNFETKFPNQHVIQIRQSASTGAASAINDGFRYLQATSECEFATWIGDDDTLVPDGISSSLISLSRDKSVVATVGRCRYIDIMGNVIHELQPRRWDVVALEFKGNKLPQPGSVFRLAALASVGLLDIGLKYAFDQDLFHKIKKIGKVETVESLVAVYCWHPGSLSSSGHLKAVSESIQLRFKHAPLLGFPVVMIHAVFAILATASGLTRLRSGGGNTLA